MYYLDLNCSLIPLQNWKISWVGSCPEITTLFIPLNVFSLFIQDLVLIHFLVHVFSLIKSIFCIFPLSSFLIIKMFFIRMNIGNDTIESIL